MGEWNCMCPDCRRDIHVHLPCIGMEIHVSQLSEEDIHVHLPCIGMEMHVSTLSEEDIHVHLPCIGMDIHVSRLSEDIHVHRDFLTGNKKFVSMKIFTK